MHARHWVRTLVKGWLLLPVGLLVACSNAFTDETGTLSVDLPSSWGVASEDSKRDLQDRWEGEVIYFAGYGGDDDQTTSFIIDRTETTPRQAGAALLGRRVRITISGDTRDLGSGELNGRPYDKLIYRNDNTNFVALVMLVSTDWHIYRVMCSSSEELWNEGRCEKAIDSVAFAGLTPEPELSLREAIALVKSEISSTGPCARFKPMIRDWTGRYTGDGIWYVEAPAVETSTSRFRYSFRLFERTRIVEQIDGHSFPCL